MAKVLACPACGNKHPLELLTGLESFLCKQCGKKLAVPSEAISVSRQDRKPGSNGAMPPKSTSEPQTTNSKVRTEIEGIDVEEVGEIQIVARSSIPADVAGEFEAVSSQHSPEIVAKSSSIQNEKIDNSKVIPDSNDPSSTNTKKKAIPALAKSGKVGGWIRSISNLQQIHIPLLGQSLSWLFAVPAGFFLVVLLPRFFGYGFHASDFVGVITHQGIGRYKIVVALVFLWSLSTVICVSLFNSLIRKLFLAKKLAT